MANNQKSLPTLATPGEVQARLGDVFRGEVGEVLGALLRILGNFAIAEEIAQV